MSLTSAYRAGDDQDCAGWRIAFTYDAVMVERLKEAIPHQYRSWDAETKTWWVAVEWEGVVLKLFPAFEAYLNQAPLL